MKPVPFLHDEGPLSQPARIRDWMNCGPGDPFLGSVIGFNSSGLEGGGY
jgi:hypothetical protein